jgi:hypothetical protein
MRSPPAYERDREGFLQGEQGGRRAAKRLQKRPASDSDPLCVFADPEFGFPVGARQVLGQWHGTKLAVGSRIDL